MTKSADLTSPKKTLFEGLHPQTIIALCATVASLGFIFNLLLSPVKEKQILFESRFDKIESRIDKLEDNMEAGFDKVHKALLENKK